MSASRPPDDTPPTLLKRETCPICRMQGSPIGAHWAWHNVCRGELNPVALLGVLERLEQTPEVIRVRDYVVLVTAMDVSAARTAVSSQPPVAPDDTPTPQTTDDQSRVDGERLCGGQDLPRRRTGDK